MEYLSNKPYVSFKVYKNQELLHIYNHFNSFPLQSSKAIYFLLWGKALNMILAKEHLSYEGFLVILSIKAAFKNGLSDSLLNDYPSVKAISLPSFDRTLSFNPNWIAGFVNGDGSFTEFQSFFK